MNFTKRLCAIALSAGLVVASQGVFAKDGQITIAGTIVAGACQISGTNGDISVTIPKIAAADITSKTKTISNIVEIKLTKCPDDISIFPVIHSTSKKHDPVSVELMEKTQNTALDAKMKLLYNSADFHFDDASDGGKLAQKPKNGEATFKFDVAITGGAAPKPGEFSEIFEVTTQYQ